MLHLRESTVARSATGKLSSLPEPEVLSALSKLRPYLGEDGELEAGQHRRHDLVERSLRERDSQFEKYTRARVSGTGKLAHLGEL